MSAPVRPLRPAWLRGFLVVAGLLALVATAPLVAGSGLVPSAEATGAVVVSGVLAAVGGDRAGGSFDVDHPDLAPAHAFVAVAPIAVPIASPRVNGFSAATFRFVYAVVLAFALAAIARRTRPASERAAPSRRRSWRPLALALVPTRRGPPGRI